MIRRTLENICINKFFNSMEHNGEMADVIQEVQHTDTKTLLAFIFNDMRENKPFFTTALQLIGAGAVLLPAMVKLIQAGVITAF